MDGQGEGDGLDAGEPTEVIATPPEPVPAPVDGGSPPDRWWRRRGALLAAVAALVVLIGAVVVVAAGGDDGDDATLASESQSVSSTSSSSSSSSTSSSSSSTTITAETSPPSSAGAITPVPKDDPPERRCVDAGGGPATPALSGWESYWQTQPQPNDPVRMRFCIEDVTVRFGQPVVATLVADDPDAVITEANCGYHVNWDANNELSGLCRDALLPVNSPRPTPAEQPGHVEVTLTHTYPRGGIYAVEASVNSAEWAGYRSPYSSYASAEIQVTVFGDVPISP